MYISKHFSNRNARVTLHPRQETNTDRNEGRSFSVENGTGEPGGAYEGKISELRSEIVHLRTRYKEDVYKYCAEIDKLNKENKAYAQKVKGLEKVWQRVNSSNGHRHSTSLQDEIRMSDVVQTVVSPTGHQVKGSNASDRRDSARIETSHEVSAEHQKIIKKLNFDLTKKHAELEVLSKEIVEKSKRIRVLERSLSMSKRSQQNDGDNRLLRKKDEEITRLQRETESQQQTIRSLQSELVSTKKKTQAHTSESERRMQQLQDENDMNCIKVAVFERELEDREFAKRAVASRVEDELRREVKRLTAEKEELVSKLSGGVNPEEDESVFLTEEHLLGTADSELMSMKWKRGDWCKPDCVAHERKSKDAVSNIADEILESILKAKDAKILMLQEELKAQVRSASSTHVILADARLKLKEENERRQHKLQLLRHKVAESKRRAKQEVSL